MPINAPGAFLPPPPKAAPPKPAGITPPAVNLRTPAPPVSRGVAITLARSPAAGRNVTTAPTSIPEPGTNPQAYAKSVIDVFRAQPAPQQRAIVQGAIKNPQIAASKLLLDYVQRANAGPLPQLAAIKAPQVGAAINATAGASHGLLKILGNAAKDAWNLPGGTIEGTFGLGKQAVEAGLGLESGNLTGAFSHLKNAASMLVDPYVRLAEHPIQTFEQHPLNTALMVAPIPSVAGKTIGAAMRTGALGDAAAEAASTARAPLHLGMVGDQPSPVTEVRSYSSNVLTKGLQRTREKSLAARGLDPNVSRPAPALMPRSLQYATNTGTEAKLFRQVDEMVANRQAMGRQVRGKAQAEVLKAAPPKSVRNVVAHIVQGVVRKPETAITDLVKERDRLTAQRTNTRTLAELSRRQQIGDISTALKHPEQLPAAFESAAKVRAAIKGMDAKAVGKGLLNEDQALRSSLFPYAQAHMGATYDHGLGSLVNPEHPKGLPTETILQHLKDNKVPDPAYVGHYSNKTAPWRYYQAYRNTRGTMGNFGRTGAAFAKGNYDHTYEGLAAQMARSAEHLTKAELHDKIVNRLGMLHPGRKGMENQMFAPGEARAASEAINRDDHLNPIPGRTQVVPITATPKTTLDNLATAKLGDLQHPSSLNDLSGDEHAKLDAAIKDAAGRTDGTRNVVLVPKDSMGRLSEQFAPAGRSLRAIGQVTQQFRRTVLPYSTHWMTQIGTEAGIRGLIAGVFDPRSRAVGRQLMAELEKSPEGQSALQEMTQATFFGQHSNLSVHNPNPNMLTSAARAKFSPLRPLIAMHNKYADFVQQAMYGLEHSARTMGLGKIARKQVQEFTGSYQTGLKLQAQNLDMLAGKLRTDPALVAKFGRQIDDIFGKYNKFTPKQRAMIQSVMPFLPWYLNAAKFVLWNLPAKHPVASALLATLRQTVNQDIQDGKQAPLNVYEMQELARLSPFGIFTPPSTEPSTGAALAGQQITESLFPQAMGSLYNLSGISSFGSGALTQPPTPGAKYGTSGYKGDVKPQSGPAVAAAAEGLLEGLVPGARYAREALAGGRPTYGASTLLSPQPKAGTKSGNAASIINRIFNPFYSAEAVAKSGPAYGVKKAAASGSGGGYVLGSGSGGATSGGGYVLGSGGSQSGVSSGGYVLGSGG